ncbi:PVC-type heme-binding CxxCH protein [Rhodopirellula sp. P2]|uniref:PVC-type heme-binding CxxCH protein n=1 Tax=Rhodopirellula sp. P2 TaxID=2127060 RepID=UPI002367560D|nr:PVC-type heme-binding CxxCH protein [Rhodopirellula sp. P2]WDQ18615.1 c-type cytochrome [Rhodopirellula sp. P2]
MTRYGSSQSIGMMILATWMTLTSLALADDPPTEALERETVAKTVAEEQSAEETSEPQEPGPKAPAEKEPPAASTVETEASSRETSESLAQWSGLAQQVRSDESLRWISLFGSQIARLVPDDFRPVAADELSQALGEAAEADAESSTDDILQCEMVATIQDGALISKASRMLFSSQAGNKQPFGKVSFAVSRLREMDDESGLETDSPTALFESSNSGLLSIATSGSDRPLANRTLAWDWRQQAMPTWNGSRWELSLPRALISRLWIQVPPNQTLHCEQAVLREVPPGALPSWYEDIADSNTGGSSLDGSRWIFVESAGSQRLDLELQTLNEAAAEVQTATIVRGCRMTLDHDGSILNWQCRLVIDPQPIASIPPWVWLRGDVTRIEVDEREVPFTSRPLVTNLKNASSQPSPASIIQLAAIEEADVPSAADSRIILVEGTAPLNPNADSISLPEPIFPTSFVVSAAPWQLQWTMPAHLFATGWQLPDDWQLLPPPKEAASSSESTSIWNAIGPPVSRAPWEARLLKEATGDAEKPDALPVPSLANSWGIQLAQSEPLLYADHQTRFLLEDNAIQARCTIQLTMASDRLAPIQLEIQDGFSFDSITVGETRRTLTINAPNRRGRRITVWPSPDEIQTRSSGEGTLEIRATGQTRRDPNNPRVNALWMIRVINCPGQMTAAVIPPADMGWTAETAITPSRIEFSELSTEQRRFFAPLPGDAIVLSQSIRQTPSLTLETPDSTIVGSCQTSLTMVRNGIQQRVQVQVEGLPQTSRSVKVRLAARSEQSPPEDMKWQTRLSPSSAFNSVEDEGIVLRWVPRQSMKPQPEPAGETPLATNVTQPTPAPGGIGGWFEWSIPVPRNFGDQSSLIGTCIHPISDVPSHKHARSESHPIGLFRLADATSQTCELSIDSELQLARPVANLVGIPTANTTAETEPFRYRYETSPHVVIQVRRKNQMPPSNLVRQQLTHVIASASGADRVRTRFEIVATQPIDVEFPWDAHLIEARINGVEVQPEMTPQHHLRFAAPLQSEAVLEMVWTTTSFETSWLRQTQVSDLRVVGLTLSSQLRITPAEDSLQIPLLGSSEAPHLIFSQIVIGIGWVGALVILAISLIAGWAARWGVACGLALSLFAMLLWPETFVSLTAWVALPLTISLLRMTTQHWQSSHRSEPSLRQPPAGPAPSNRSVSPSHSAGGDPPSDFSSSALLRNWIGWAIIGTFVISGGVASAQTRDVLVPLDSNNQPMGNKAYIPESLYEDLFLIRSDERVRQVSFLNTNYELDLTSERSKRAISLAREEFPIELLARFTVETSIPSSRLRLPFSPESIEELVLIRPDESTRVLTTTTDDQPGTLIVVPSGNRFDLQLRLRCETSHHATGTQITTELPSLPQARLVVRRDYRIHNYRVVTDNIAWPAVDRPVGFGVISSNQFSIGPCSQLHIHLQSKATVDALASDIAPASENEADAPNNADGDAQLPEAWNTASQWKRRYWLNATTNHCSIECELEPLQPPPPGGEVILRFHRETTSIPRLLSRDWKLLRQTPNQWMLTRVSSSAEPLRLVWDLSSAWSAESGAPVSEATITEPNDSANPPESPVDDERVLSCPGLSLHDHWQEPDDDESPLANSRTVFAETLVAWTLSSELQPLWPASLGTERVPSEQFYAQWLGSISRLDRAAKSSGTTPIVRIGIVDRSRLVFHAKQEIHLDSSHQSIRLEATFDPNPVTADSATANSVVGTIDPNGEDSTPTLQENFRPQMIKIAIPPQAQIFNWRIQQPGLPDTSPAAAGGLASTSEAPETATLDDDEADAIADPTTLPADSGSDPSGTQWKLVREHNRDCLLIRYEGRGMEVMVEAQVEQRKSNDNALALMHIEPVHSIGDISSVNEVVVSRSANANIQWKTPPPFEGEKSGDAGPASMLAAGKILMDQWLIRDSALDVLGDARFRVTPIRHPFQTDVRVSLRWEEGRWIAQTDIQLNSKQSPDFLDVEMPSRWCDALQIHPLCASTRQPTLSPARQVIRIRLADQGIRSIRLTSRLAAGDLLRVSVPKIRVLQAQRSRTDIVVPNRLTNAPIRWETNGVEPMPQPRWNLPAQQALAKGVATDQAPTDQAPTDQEQADQEQTNRSNNEGTDQAPTQRTTDSNEEHSYFRVASENWSVELEPLRKTNNVAAIMHADHQLLNDRFLVSRFDIVPGDASHLTLNLPEHTRFVAGWTNGLPADVISLPAGKLQFLLPLSRLSQGIEVLLKMDEGPGNTIQPESSTPSWDEIQTPPQCTYTRLLSRRSNPANLLSLSNRSSADASTGTGTPDEGNSDSIQPDSNGSNQESLETNASRWEAITSDQRWQILATNTVRSIAAASDSLADRRDEEVAAWMKSWLQRYASISQSAGLRFDPTNASIEDSVSLERVSAELTNRPPESLFSWSEMESFLALQIQRYSANETDDWWQRNEASKLGDGQWSFVLTSQKPDRWIVDSQYQSSEQSLPPQWSTPSSSPMTMQWAQHGMRFLLLLTSACLLIVLRLQPSRTRRDAPQANWVTNIQDLMAHPATWIFGLGCIAMILAPIPLALALMVTAVMLSGFETFWKTLRRRLRLWASALLVLILCSSPFEHAAAQSNASPSPSDIADTMRVRDGWKLQLVAAEPMTIDPVSAAWDPQGRLWVVEMPDYPQPAEDAKPTKGRIRVLSDTNGDGVMDQATTFADGLNFATGVLPWPSRNASEPDSNSPGAWLDGAIVTLAGEIAWLRDTDGDGLADDHQTWFRGFTTGNEQLRANHPTLGPDGLVYVANGLRGGKIEAIAPQFDSKAGPLTLSQNDFCFDPRGGHWGRVSGNSQHGLTIDDFGRRIGCSNRNPAIQAVLDADTIQRDRELAPVDALLDIAAAGEHSEVHPISDAWTTSHLHAGQFSAACGVLAVNDKWLLVCEPTGSLVQRQRMRLDGENWRATREPVETEWLANEHTWFRPVDLVADQADAVLVLDMARAVIEHPDWAPEELKNRPDTWHGNDLGRIWRLVPPGVESGFQSIQNNQDAIEALRSDDPVRRSLATLHLTQHLADPTSKSLVEKKLSELLQSPSTNSPTQARAAALLAQLGNLTPEQQSKLTTESEPRLRAIAARLTPQWDAKTFRSFASDDSALVRRVALENFLASDGCEAIADHPQTAEFHSVMDSLNKLAVEQADSKLIAKLLPSVPPPMLHELVRRSIEADETQLTADHRSNLLRWIRRSAATDSETTLDLISSVDAKNDSLQFVANWITGVRSTAKIKAAIEGSKADFFARVAETAKATLVDPDQDHDRRKDAVEVLLALAPHSSALRDRLTDSTDAELRSRILDGLLKTDPEWTRSILVSHQDPWRPEERGVVCRRARSDSDTAKWLLLAVKQEHLPRSFVDATTANALRSHRDKTIRELANQTFAPPEDRAKVLEQYAEVANRFSTADVSTGRKLFAQHCSNCHRMEGVGHAVGPDISDSRTKTAEALLVAVLNPDAAIDASFTRYQILTVDGEVVSGLLHKEDSDSVTLLEAGNQQRRVNRDDIETFRAVDASLMPSGMEQTLSVDQMSDLIGYLKRWRYTAEGL